MDTSTYTYTMTINGQPATAHKTFEVLNPNSCQIVAQCPEAAEDQVDESVRAAKAALNNWMQDETLRRKLLGKIPSILKKYKDTLSSLTTDEQGKPLRDSIKEVNDSIHIVEHELRQHLPVEKMSDKEGSRTIHVLHKAVGVVAIITPWNYPLVVAVGKMITPLIMGNTVVFKPAPTTPLSSLLLGELLRNILPPGVVNVISGGDEVGRWLAQHPDVNLISFTGSVETGKKIAAVASRDLKRVILELGGNDPAIILPDIDVKKKAEEIFWGAFTNCGQICTAIKRLYVHESIFEPMVKALTELAKNVKVGDGKDPDTEIGPLNNREQLSRVEELVEDAKAHGAKIETGGERFGDRGYFYKPTIVTDIQEGVRLVDEEQFGPVLPVMSFKTVEEAVERANRTQMGLGASVWSDNEKQAWEIASQLEAGVVWVNHVRGGLRYCPMGGFKQSGIGRVNGRWGLEGASEIQGIITPT